jgi:hypothetical protein
VPPQLRYCDTWFDSNQSRFRIPLPNAVEVGEAQHNISAVERSISVAVSGAPQPNRSSRFRDRFQEGADLLDPLRRSHAADSRVPKSPPG